MPDLVFATNNPHKLKEAKAILPAFIRLKSLQDIGCFEELPETGNTLEANALQKARYVYEKYGAPCMADDTGLEVSALGGEPGVYSARYAGPQADPVLNLEKLLREMKGVPDRQARFRTVIALMGVGDQRFFEGTVNGAILEKPVGESGFGYDPVFIPDGYGHSFSEMSPELKNALSHRGIALRSMSAWIEQRIASGF